MAVTITPIDIGTVPGDDTGDTPYIAGGNINTNFNNVKTAVETLQADVMGKQTIYVPASSITPTIANGCAALSSFATSADRPDIIGLAFDATADEHAQFAVEMPKSWDGTDITFKVSWESAATGTTGVAWGLQTVAVGDGETIDVVYNSPVVVTDDAQSTAEMRYVSAESATITVTGVFDDIIYFRIFRDVSDGNDDMTEDAILTTVRIFYTTDAGNDT